MANNIIWDHIMDICDNIQKQINDQDQLNINEGIKQEKMVREECFEKALVKLAYWKQRAKGKWAALGIVILPFVFRCAKQRKIINEIRMIQDDDGNWVSESEEIKNVICKHFKSLFKRMIFWRALGF